MAGPAPSTTPSLTGRGRRVAIVASRFNESLTTRLVDGARAALSRHGVRPADLRVVWVPGAFELAQTAARLAASGSVDALVCVGCVIRGETPHFDYVCMEASLGLGAVARSATIPVAFGVLTTDDLAQAKARAGSGTDNKGYEAAMAVLEMVSMYRRLGTP